MKEASKGKAATRAAAPKKQKTADTSAPPTTLRSNQAPTAHGSQAMDIDAQGLKKQHSGAPYPYPFTHAPQYGGATSSAALPAPPPAPEAQSLQDRPMATAAPKGHQPASPTIPRTFCDEILTVLANFPDEWPLVKIDMILNKAEAYYVPCRRYLYLNERLRAFYENSAARTIDKNKDRILEHWHRSSASGPGIEPAKELTRGKGAEFLFLHDKDFWFRSIWTNLHQALTIDRESSRDRAPVGFVRCICKDDQAKGPNARQIHSKSITFMLLRPLDGPHNAQESSTHCCPKFTSL